MALIRCGAGGANVLTLGELTFTQLSEAVASLVNTFHKASINTGTTGYNKIAIVSSTRLTCFTTGGAGASIYDFTLGIDPSTGVATISTTGEKGFIANYEPKLTVVLWKE